jgi:hypothetical protein
MDTSWVDEYAEHEEKYGKFYKEENEICNIRFMYLNQENEIIFVSEDKLDLDEGRVPSQTLMKRIEEKRERYNERYMIYDIFFYNITTNSEDLIRFKDRALYKNYLHKSDVFQEITFKPTISMFKDLNEIIVLLKKKPYEFTRKNKSRKMKQSVTQSNSKTSNNRTKKT